MPVKTTADNHSIKSEIKWKTKSNPWVNLILAELNKNWLEKDQAEGCVQGTQYFLVLLPVATGGCTALYQKSPRGTGDRRGMWWWIVTAKGMAFK